MNGIRGRGKNNRLWRRHRAGKNQTFLVFFEILDGGIKAPLGNKNISQQIPLGGLMSHAMNLSPLKSPTTPPAPIKFFGRMSNAEFSFLQLVMLPNDLLLSCPQKGDSLGTGKIPHFRESRWGKQ
jgi:hypothetical protein